MTIVDALTTAQWRKSSRTAQGGSDCVEVADLSCGVAAQGPVPADEEDELGR